MSHKQSASSPVIPVPVNGYARDFTKAIPYVLQMPKIARLGIFTAEEAAFTAILTLDVSLSYNHQANAGRDQFHVSLTVKRPRQPPMSEPHEDTAAVTRTVNTLDELRSWLNGRALEEALCLLLGQQNEACEVAVRRILFRLADVSRELDVITAADEKRRLKLHYSPGADNNGHGVTPVATP